MIYQQVVHVQDPPAHTYVVQAVVPILGGPDNLTLQLDDYPSDSRVIAHARGWSLFEVCALAGPGDGLLLVHPGAQSPAGALSVHQAAANRLNFVILELNDDFGTQSFSLTGQPRLSWHRRGNVMRTSYHHLNLGRFGWAHLWISMRAGTEQLDFILELHNGVPGPDRRLNWAKINSVLPWQPVLPDPACAPPYLVKPGRYVIPQQFGRPFRFSVGTTHEPEHIGVGDWSQGGFLPAAFPVPGMIYQHPLADARIRLQNLLPSPSYGPTPTGPLWPANGGATQTDEGGGQDRLPLLGVRWAATGDPAALEFYQIEQLRSQSRARRRYDLLGLPPTLPLTQTWSFFDGFLQGQDAPWEWDRWSSPWSPPKTFNDHGMGSLTRSLNDNLALVWLANDPLAKFYVLETATRARLTFFSIPPAATPGLGTDLGGFHAQAALAIAAARSLGATEYESWVIQYRAHMRAAQMPSGVLVARLGGYPFQNPPFDSQYLLSGAAELELTMLALYELGGADDVVRKCASGLFWLATDDEVGDPSSYYYFPTGPADGSSMRYVTRADWPPTLELGGDDSSYYSFWNDGIGFALAKSTGAPEALDLLLRGTQTTSATQAVSVMQSWGLEAPDGDWTNTPIDNWYPLLGVWMQ